jgi:hypothetical protein
LTVEVNRSGDTKTMDVVLSADTETNGSNQKSSGSDD